MKSSKKIPSGFVQPEPAVGYRVARRSRVGVKSVALTLSVLALAGCSQRSLPRDTQTVDGITIDLGVMPAELVQGHSIQPGDPQAMHGGAPAYSGSHHIVVALFDTKTGARITDARVRAGVGNHSYDHKPDKWLEPMLINNTTTYGGFFPMPGSDEWRIHLAIERPGRSRPTEATFGYQHPSDY